MNILRTTLLLGSLRRGLGSGLGDIPNGHSFLSRLFPGGLCGFTEAAGIGLAI